MELSAVANRRSSPEVDPTLLQDVIEQVSGIILGKRQAIRLALTCLLARGHLLIEDLPGMGKTTLAHALAQTLGLQYQRVQFTSDLLPADLIGAAIFDRNEQRFVFHRGPIFTQLVLADEINRATPKTQSALLECMEEAQITADSVTYSLPAPFFVIATQNPSFQVGTFPLPESQLDRFLMRIHLGYPDPAAERELLAGVDRRRLLAESSAVITPEQLLHLQASAEAIHIAPRLLDYIQALLTESRRSSMLQNGLSPRAGLGLLNAARAWALLEQRDFVTPEDVQAVLPAVAGHRLQTLEDQGDQSALLNTFIEAVPVPL
ncbi:MAG: MoxR family ATPase [Gammaproteobacteria bacterium]